MTYGEMLEQANKDVADIHKSTGIILKAIYRPIYDNRRLGSLIDWIVDNFSECKDYYNSLPADGLWEKEAIRFMQCQYDGQVFSKFWEDKNGGEYRDQIAKDSYDRMISDRDGEG